MFGGVLLETNIVTVFDSFVALPGSSDSEITGGAQIRTVVRQFHTVQLFIILLSYCTAEYLYTFIQ